MVRLYHVLVRAFTLTCSVVIRLGRSCYNNRQGLRPWGSIEGCEGCIHRVGHDVGEDSTAPLYRATHTRFKDLPPSLPQIHPTSLHPGHHGFEEFIRL